MGCRSNPFGGSILQTSSIFIFKIKKGWVWEVSSQAGAGGNPLAIANLPGQNFAISMPEQAGILGAKTVDDADQSAN